MGKELEKRERLPVSVSSAVFIEDEQGRLLLLQQAAERKGHRWGPPAGGMEAHEDPMMTARRETEEEIGVSVELKDVVGIYTVDRGDSAAGIGFVFRGQIASGEITPREDEIMDFSFFSPDEIEELIKTDMLYKPEYNLSGIQDWIEGKSFALEVIKALST
ncbi:MAG: NUDIX hydrolase [Patescibacteria group bacterium]